MKRCADCGGYARCWCEADKRNAAIVARVVEQSAPCAGCGRSLVLHRIGDDACPIIDGNALSFDAVKRFRPVAAA